MNRSSVLAIVRANVIKNLSPSTAVNAIQRGTMIASAGRENAVVVNHRD